MIASRLPTPTLKARLKSGPAVGCHWLSLGSPVLAELAAEAEPDAIVVDMQHGPWDRSSLETAVGLVAGRAPVLARVADASDFAIGSAMDAGAHGVIVPMINTAAECASVVSAARYPPNGRRSGGGARTGADFAAYRAAEQHLVTAIMIETAEGVDNAAAIAATPGLDMIFIGPSDLSLSLGHGWGTPVFEDALKRVLDAGAAHGVPVGVYTVSTEQALQRALQGFRFMVAASDVAINRGGGRTAIKAFKAGAPGAGMSALANSTAATALAGAQEHILRIPLENISTLAKGAFGDPSIIPLWFGEGDRPAPAFIGEALKQAIDDGHVFYTHQNGIPELRQALSDYLTGLNARPVAADRFTVTFSGMNAIMLGLQLVCRPGDNVVVIDPVWPNVGGMARLLDCQVRSVAMDHGPAGWSLDLDKVAAVLDERTRAVFFASPGNPTGAMLPMATQTALLDLCRQRGVWLMADEVYNRLVFGRRNAESLLDHADPEDRLFVVNSFSKSWAMTGWRLGWLVHPPSLGPTLAMQTQYSTSGVTTFLQHAGVAALQQGEPFVASIRDYCEAGMGIVCDALDRFGRVRMGPRPAAGMYAYFEVDGLPDSRQACLEILDKTHVGLAPGYFFNSDTFLRLCVARAPETLAEAMGRLEPLLS